MDSETRVMIVLSNALERAVVRRIIEEERTNRVVAETADGESALALDREFNPDIAVVESSLTDMPALGLVHFLHRQSPRIQALIYTKDCDRDWLIGAVREGVRAFVLSSQPRQLLPALRALADHRPYWEGAVEDKLLEELLESDPRPLPSSLTHDDWQVLQMAAEGRTTKEMARATGLSARAVEAQRTRLRRELGFRNMADLVRFAEQRDPVGE